jgi:DNA polymerase/3'-5' exonuclease PolX
MNIELINKLKEFVEISSLLGNPYREKAYRKAIITIEKLQYEINRNNVNKIDIKDLPGIGTGIYEKIKEFVNIGKIKELDELKKTKKYKTVKELNLIAGVGPATIEKWMKMKIDSIPKLRKAVGSGKIKLNNMQKYGLLYYKDLNEQIPRDEVTRLAKYIENILKTLNKNLIFTIAGSYRRGKQTSGDIDILISNPHKFNKNILREFADNISKDENFIVLFSIGDERLTFIFRSSYRNNYKVRQIDILNLSIDKYYPGILYFTGSGEFNEAMRGYAKRKGYLLNQNGLFKNKKKIIVTSEKEIFYELGLKYIEPKERGAPKLIEI